MNPRMEGERERERGVENGVKSTCEEKCTENGNIGSAWGSGKSPGSKGKFMVYTGVLSKRRDGGGKQKGPKDGTEKTTLNRRKGIRAQEPQWNS